MKTEDQLYVCLKWISVTHRLPEFNQACLLYWNGVMCVGAREEYGSSWKFTDGEDDDTIGLVTHWMPLPKPPFDSAP